MKSQSNVLSNGKSLFSMNTHNSIVPLSNPSENHLHSFYSKIAKDQSYPYLSKILFLQLILRENVLIYCNTDNRVQIKQVWNSINKKIGQNVGNVYIIGQDSNMIDILNNKSEYKRALLYDLTQISNQGLNYLLNQQETLTLTIVQNVQKNIRVELTDIFPLIFHYNGEEEPLQLTNKSPSKMPENTFNKDSFEKDKLYQCITSNYNLSIQQKDQQNFLKPYLSILKSNLSKNKLNIPNSRWKKMIKVINFIGLTKSQGSYKKLNLSDCLFCSECLGRSSQEIQIIKKCNQESILEILPYYGGYKFKKQLSSHFWVDQKRKEYFLSLSDQLKGCVSFFYPCTKYPQVMKICHENNETFYSVSGRDKKLMSDRYYEIDPSKKYKISLKYRSKKSIIMHFGVACYDQNKNLIYPVQVCRYQNTEVTIQSLQHDKITIISSDRQNLKNWKDQSSFNYQKCIGFYISGNTDKMLSLEDLVYNQQESYSKENGKGVYKQILEDGILLTQFGCKLFKNIKNSIKKSVSKLMNHYQGGTYCIGSTENGVCEQWKEIETVYHGESRQNNGKSFLQGTNQIRIVIMSNYNSGFPQFKIQDKNAVVQICEIKLIC